jgi:hypothetical protein
MRIVLTAILLGVFTACSSGFVKPTSAATAVPLIRTTKTPILVELFTAEGCSSCPPAEALLAKYQNEQPFEDAELITLAFHVDYWDYIGWKDKYASPLFTQRQRVYDRKFRTGKIYTPQMIVDGNIEFIGSREKDALKAFKKAAQTDKASITLAVDGEKISVSVKNLTSEEISTLYIAVAEDNLNSDIRNGENAGRNLTHLSVVRKLIGAGRIPANSAEFKMDYTIQTQPDWNRENLKLVVFVQENQSRSVLAVSQIDLPETE